MKSTSIDLCHKTYLNDEIQKICPRFYTYKYVYITDGNALNFALRISSYKNIITAQIIIFTCFLSHIYHIYKFYLTLNLNAVCIETGNNPLTNDWDHLACKPQYQILWHRYLGSIQPISLVEFHYTSNLLANIQSTPVSSLHEKPKVHSKIHSQCL